MGIADEIAEYEALKTGVVNSGTLFHGVAVPVDEQTPNHQIPLPHPLRPAVLEVVRLRAAFLLIDTALDATHSNVSEDITAAVTALEQKLLGGAGGAYDTLQELFALMQSGDTTLQAAIDALTTTASQNTAVIGTLESAVTQNAADVGTLESTVAQNGVAVQNIQNQVDGLQGGGPSKGAHSIIRTNAKNIAEDIVLSDHETPFVADVCVPEQY